METTTNQNQHDTEQQKHLAWSTRLSELLLMCYETLDVFGKQPEQLETIKAAFQLILADYPIEAIEGAFKVYLRDNTVMPKPANIVKIIKEQRIKDAKNNRVDGMALITENLYGTR